MDEIAWTDEAQRWLSDIYAFVAADNPVAAVQTAHGIFERAQALKTHPEIDRRYLASSRNVRILLYGHYRVAYLVREMMKASTSIGSFTGHSTFLGTKSE